MVLNYIWIGFFLIAFLVALIRTILYYFRDSLGLETIMDTADKEVFSTVVKSTFDMAETSVDISIYLIGIMTLWLGIMKIGEMGGAVNGMARVFGPLFSKLFPEIPKGHAAHGAMVMNFSANMLGLDNAATPLGLKAMKELQKENPSETVASNSQIMFLVLNTSGLTLIPVSVMALRASAHALNPADIFLPILLATYFSTLVGLITVSIWQKISLFDKTILTYLGAISAVIGFIIWSFMQMTPDQISTYSSVIGNGMLFTIIAIFVVLGLRKKINVYETFIDGAKEGFQTSVKIIPYLVAMLVAIGVFRASGAMEYLIDGLKWFFGLFFTRLEFVDTLQVAFMKPLSGSGARGAMLEVFDQFGIEDIRSKMAAALQGSTETTFYVLAVYFGSVGIKNSRYAVTAGLMADLAGIIAAILLSYMFFG